MFLRTETFRQFIKFIPIISNHYCHPSIAIYLDMQLPFFPQNWILGDHLQG